MAFSRYFPPFLMGTRMCEVRFPPLARGVGKELVIVSKKMLVQTLQHLLQMLAEVVSKTFYREYASTNIGISKLGTKTRSWTG